MSKVSCAETHHGIAPKIELIQCSQNGKSFVRKKCVLCHSMRMKASHDARKQGALAPYGGVHRLNWTPPEMLLAVSV